MGETNQDDVSESSVSAAFVPGTLYFMRERDFLTGEEFDYFKIGIVKGDRSVEKREEDHKTGNPRRVYTIRELSSVAVQKLETMLHNEFASNRVSSAEWFHFPDESIEAVINRALELNARLDEEIESLKQAKAIKAPGSAPVIRATAEILADAELLALTQAEQKIVKKRLGYISERILELTEGRPEFENLIKYSNQPRKHEFAVSTLSKDHKALYLEFKILEKISTRPQFLTPLASPSADEVYQKYGLETKDLSDVEPVQLHQAYLAHWSLVKKLDWEGEILKSRILVAGKDASGIGDVLAWEQTKKIEFDKAAFQAAHPDVYDSCFKTSEAHVSRAIAEWASYKI